MPESCDPHGMIYVTHWEAEEPKWLKQDRPDRPGLLQRESTPVPSVAVSTIYWLSRTVAMRWQMDIGGFSYCRLTCNKKLNDFPEGYQFQHEFAASPPSGGRGCRAQRVVEFLRVLHKFGQAPRSLPSAADMLSVQDAMSLWHHPGLTLFCSTSKLVEACP